MGGAVDAGLVTEDMRVAPDHFVDDGGGDVVDIEMTGFSGHLSVEDDLQQQIAQFVLQLGHVAVGDRLGDFIGLFDGVGRNGRECLFHIPRAAAIRIPEAPHHRDQVLEGGFTVFVIEGFVHGEDY